MLQYNIKVNMDSLKELWNMEIWTSTYPSQVVIDWVL